MYYLWVTMGDGQSQIKPMSTTGIGSLPHMRASDAAALCLESFDIPFWPQLPNVSFTEQMIPQYAEGLPSLKVDPERRSIWVERNEEEMARFYESVAERSRVAISKESAHGLYAFLEKVKTRRFPFLKGQITGPVTFTLGLVDREGKPIYYDEEMREISLMLLQAKARWQVDILSAFAHKVIIFIDEPILSALGGTTYMGVSPEETHRLLAECARAIREVGALSGIHCCGRAEWPLVMKTGVDILNFDAYEFGFTLGIYPEETKEYLSRGGYVAWGIVPTSEVVRNEDDLSLARLFRETMESLTKSGIPEDLLLSRSLLTPSCGTGSLSVEDTLKVFQTLMRLKEGLT
jgi:methionine synthase II (cobalamin-independent)